MKYLTIVAATVALSTSASSVCAASITIDPDGTGATGVFLNNPSQVIVGFGREGTLEVAGGGSDTVTLRGDSFFAIGFEDQFRPRSSGLLRVVGDGTAGRTNIASNNGIDVGFSGDGRLELSNGAGLQTEFLTVGSTAARGEVMATGETTIIEANTLDVRGNNNFGIATDSELVLSDGAQISIRNNSEGFLGFSFLDGNVILSDRASLDVETQIVIAGNVVVSDGASLNTNLAILNNSNSGSGIGQLTVENGGVVSVSRLEIREGGVLGGDGGLIVGDVVLAGGSIAPGASPGRLDIDGNLEVFDGLLQIEIAGTSAGMFDQLNITGDLISSMGFDIEISFLDSFVPQDGDVFNFLNIAGDSSIFDTPSLINFSVNGGGFFGNNARLDFASGSLSIINDTNIAPVPLPAGLPLLAAGLIGLGALARRKKAA